MSHFSFNPSAPSCARRPRAAALIALLLTLLGFVGSARALTELDRIVAVVNDDVITQSELDRQMDRVRDQLQQHGTPIPPRATLERQVLERLVLMHIQLQLAAKTGIRVDDDTLNHTIKKIAAQNHLSLSKFREILERDGYPFSQFRKDIRDEITVSRLQQRQVENRITVTDREIDNYLATQKQQGGLDREYHLEHILIAVPEAASPEQIEASRKKAEKILEKLRNGANFSEVAVANSDGQQALEGGDLGWLKAGRMPTIFAGIVPGMKEGQISDLIRSPSGFHIIKLLGVRRGKKMVIEQTHVRHILIKPNQLVTDQEARTRLEHLRTRILGGASFAELARSHSDDKGSAANGGDLGWVNPGDLVPKFEKVMNGLKVGQVSQPFRTEFGWHIVQVLGRRKHDSTKDIIRTKAREAIFHRKLQEEREAWLRELRDEAYVEYHLNDNN